MKKHSDVLSYRKGRILDVKRAECSTEENVRYYHHNLSNAISKLDLADKPTQIWNCDETGVTAQGNCNERVICPKGMPAYVQRSSHYLQPLDVGVYRPFKSLYNAGVSEYPLTDNGTLPVKDDVGEISKAPFEQAFSGENITRGLCDTGFIPLLLEVMLNKMIGNKPAPNAVTLRYHSMMVPHF
ncbi:hypothetical protein PC129_g22128 [Phytophthora cactorum]|uniref:Uncharacterized protein n=1 Tax=Phytophthora cactorum TaxID=29920 RepID=A0A8T1FHL9_9STRA|nr:hypothetical protein Pcac1_g9792 [Phytophthora cactorum]KAG2894571.1 hypothetical protein PC114_g15848 [Phytophthora cactorum]KAG2972656.1 hypothetical protein PC118_g15574 [Phytophthora cactorum]KAG3001878.1 hypothetical protein PC119_g16555 [Phytophthora cactorum]KAG3069987.1 hypothetical protein PC122_g16325 [Phytophthora cactorum]